MGAGAAAWVGGRQGGVSNFASRRPRGCNSPLGGWPEGEIAYLVGGSESEIASSGWPGGWVGGWEGQWVAGPNGLPETF